MKTATLVRALKISALRMQWKQANKFEAEILKRIKAGETAIKLERDRWTLVKCFTGRARW